METVEELKSYDYSFVTTVTTAVQSALKGKTLSLVIKDLKQIEKEYKMNYLIDVARLLMYSPFISLNQKVESDPYNTKQLTRLNDAYDLYQVLGQLAHFDTNATGL
jgi:hypothetical protein